MSEILIDGFLKKKSPKGLGGMRSWQKRRFVLCADQIIYGKPKSKRSSGMIPIDSVSSITHSTSKNKGCRFDIILPQRTFALIADTREEATHWVKQIRTLVSQIDRTGKRARREKQGKFWKHKEDFGDTGLETVAGLSKNHRNTPSTAFSSLDPRDNDLSSPSQQYYGGFANGYPDIIRPALHRPTGSLVSDAKTTTTTTTSSSDAKTACTISSSYSAAYAESIEQKIDDEDLFVADYIIEDNIASGPFGQICVVQHCNSADTFLMQLIETSSDEFDSGIKSMDIFEKFECTYLMHQTARGVTDVHWAVYSYPLAGALFVYLRNSRRFPFEIAQLYIAEVLEVTDYLHSLNYVFTNMGPEQIFLDHDGHIHVSDFLIGTDESDYTGTPEYTNPEFLTDGINNSDSDWWRLGILLYEFCVGVPPFRVIEGERVTDKIVDPSVRIAFPPFLSADTLDLIRKLLVRDPSKRLGYEGGAASLRSHPFFDGIDWQAIRSRRVPPPATIVDQILYREKIQFEE